MMLATSTGYNPYPSSRWADLRVRFRLIDRTAKSDATIFPSGSATISQVSQVLDDNFTMSAKWATLEDNFWALDGTFDLLPDSVAGLQTGWWSDVLSGTDGAFVSPPSLTFTFTQNHSSIGFTIYFDDKSGEYATRIKVMAYDSSDTVIDGIIVLANNATKCIIDFPVENYRKIVFEFLRANPRRHVRVSEVFFGIIQDFDRDNIKTADYIFEISPTVDYLPTTEMRLTIDNSDDKYNMGSPNSVYAFLQTGQPIDSELGVGASRDGIEFFNMGRLYFTRSSAEDGTMTAEIVANDRMLQLDRAPCKIGTTGTWTVTQAVAAVLSDSGMSVTVIMPVEIASRVIGKAIPQNATHRVALRLICQAGCCSCFFNRADELEFFEFAIGSPVDALNNNNLSSYARPVVSERINTVILTVRNEYAQTEATYTAQALGTNELPQVWSLENPLATQATADWLLTMKQMRRQYELPERGNPAREVGDTVTVTDKYGREADAVITYQEFSYDGTLSAIAKAVN